MFRRKTAQSQKRHNVIGYNGVNVDENTQSTTASFLFSWRVLFGKMYMYHHRGVLWAVVAVSVTTSFSLCIKLLAGKVAASQGMFMRGFIQTLFSIPHLAFHRVSLLFPTKVFLLIISRSLVGSLCTFLNYFAIQSLPVGTARALAFSSPLFTGVFAHVCLGERCSVRIVLFSCLTVIAVMLVVQPPFIFGAGDVTKFYGVGMLCAIMGAMLLAANTIILRFLQIRHIDVHAITFIYGNVMTSCGGVVATALGQWTNPQCGLDRAFVIGMAVTGFLEQISVTLALKTEPALVVSIIRTNEVFVSFALDVLIFDISPNPWTVVGGIMVVVSSAGIICQSRKQETAERKRKRMSVRRKKIKENNKLLYCVQRPGIFLYCSSPVELPSFLRENDMTDSLDRFRAVFKTRIFYQT